MPYKRITRFNALKDEVNEVFRPEDPRWLQKIPYSEELQTWVDDVVATLGGYERATPQQLSIISAAAKSYLYIEVIDNYLMRQDSLESALINRSKKTLYPIVLQRHQIMETLARQLNLIGLQPQTLPTETFAGYIKARAEKALPDAASESTTTADDHDFDEHPAAAAGDDFTSRYSAGSSDDSEGPTPAPTILSPGTGFLYVDYRAGDDEETLARDEPADIDSTIAAPPAPPATASIRTS